MNKKLYSEQFIDIFLSTYLLSTPTEADENRNAKAVIDTTSIRSCSIIRQTSELVRPT